ncbi:MAG: transposase, partial [Candidatus Avilachnospira sp.]
MAQLNITLNQDEILQLLSADREDAFKQLLQDSLNGILNAESTAQLGAEKYERSEERTDSRNGSGERKLHTRLGTIDLTVPRHRNVPFKTMIFDN